MNPDSLIRQALLFAHLLAFAVAFATVLREDARLLRERRIEFDRLRAAARVLTWALALLWLSGLALVMLDTGADAARIAANPKLVAKLLVVSVLTANGMALHGLVFARLARAPERDPLALALPAVLGAVSSASWLCASFIGASRIIAPAMRLADYFALYALTLAAAVTAALWLGRRPALRAL